MKILVTGGAGYIGSVLCEHLLDAGHEVTVLDNLFFGQCSHFHLVANENYHFVFGDCRDESTVSKYLRDADVVIPLAAVVGAPACDRDPQYAKAVNYEAVKLINGLRSKDQLLILPMTNSGYGTKTGEDICTEESPLEPISLYGETKVNAENEILSSENALSFRLATVFGFSPRMRIDLLVNHFVYAALTDGALVLFEKDFKRNFIHVRDVAECMCFAIENGKAMVGQPYNLGIDSANMSKAQLAEKIKEYIPSLYVHYAEIGSDPDKRDYIVSNERLRQAGFEASRTIDKGIVELMKGYEMMKRNPLRNV